MDKIQNALSLVRHVLLAMGFTEHPNQKKISEPTDYSIDSTFSRSIRLYFKTGVVATEVVLRLKAEFEIIGTSEGVSTNFGSIVIGVSHINSLKEKIIAKLGPIDDKKQTTVPAPQLSSICLQLKNADLKVGNRTKSGGYWGLYFDDAIVAQKAFVFLKPIFPTDGVVHTEGTKAVKIKESLVQTKERKKESRNIPDQVGIVGIKNSVNKKTSADVFAAEVTKLATRFIVEKTSDFEKGYQEKLGKHYHLISKKEEFVKIPAKYFGSKIILADGFMTIPVGLIAKHIKKE